MLKRLLSSSRKVPYRVCGVIHCVTHLPLDGSMVFVKWKIKEQHHLRGALRSANGMTQPAVVRSHTVTWEHPFTADIPMQHLPENPDHVMTLVVHTLRGGTTIEQIGSIEIDLPAKQKDASTVTYLLRNSRTNAVLHLTLALDPLVATAPAEAVTRPTKQRPRLYNDLDDDTNMTWPLTIPSSATKAAGTSTTPRSVSKKAHRRKLLSVGNDQMAIASDADLVDAVFNSVGDAQHPPNQ